ncbi:MFS transporter [Ktedonobacter robiniae]|uniref:MFS transporter n=1 Tax=Ktedonobacter robiniae TaxID=2778365 RepID=A0ABQ3UY19_9CHLR|nr:MFS transporter [Ktedonobacter robiniae]GHO57585.1 MFS transporter [Ktedonobacter robiniae]
MRLRFGALWRQPDFLKLWTGESISLFGSQVTTLALPLVAIITLHATPWQVAMVSTAIWAPYLFFTIFAGWWADNHRRRPLLIAANLGQAALLVLLPGLAFFHLLRIEYVYIIAFLIGMFAVFFNTAYKPYLLTLIGREHLLEGNSKLQVSAAVAQIGGPGTGGLLVQLVTAPFALLIDAGSFVVSALGLLLIRKREPAPEVAPASEPAWRQIVAGLILVFRNPILRVLVLASMTYNFFGVGFETLFVVYATRDLLISPALLGTILAMGSIGALFGALIADPLAKKIGLGPALILMTFLECVVMLFIPFIGGSFVFKVACLVGVFLVNGMGLASTNIYYPSLRQAITDDAFLGRVNASIFWLILGAVPIGSAIAGGLQGLIGLRWTLVCEAVGLLFSVAWVLGPRIRTLHTLPTIASKEVSEETLPTAQPEILPIEA